ncbi:MAG: glutathione peroxidase [Croceitalea sp.]|nr:glutathione peroxidase [Croceitalea sp.]
MRLLKGISKKVNPKVNLATDENQRSLYDIEITTLDGSSINLSDFEGKYLLFVNVASKCGFTGQYQDLEKLYQAHKDKLVVIGLPCNQFGAQEPGSAEQIQTFCERNYGVSFPMTEKIEVKGANQHPLYQWLTKKSLNGKLNSTVKWNFQKYLVGPKGEFIDVFYSITKPMNAKITKLLV